MATKADLEAENEELREQVAELEQEVEDKDDEIERLEQDVVDAEDRADESFEEGKQEGWDNAIEAATRAVEDLA